MRFRILGALEADGADGGRSSLRPREARALAVLLLCPNEVVTVGQLVDGVWDGAPPVSARRQIQNTVWLLRRAFPIVTDGPGYRLAVAPADLDALVFADTAARAHAAAAGGLVDDAVRGFREALGLWRGPALAGLTGRTLEAGAARLDEQRLSTFESCVDIELALGRHHALVAELTELVALNPTRERLVGQLMLARHRCGRQAEALAAYRDLRAQMIDELGVEPGDAVTALHTALLRNEAGRVSPPDTVPRQLPSAVRQFVGRRAQLGQLMAGRRHTSVATITGTAGVGKTTLAVHWCHQLAESFPDGQLYVDLRGFAPSATPTSGSEAVRGFLEALGVDPQRIPAAFDAQTALYRSLLAGRRVLVLLDNARDAEQVRPLLPGTDDCLTVVTSRDPLTGLVASVGASPVVLDLMPPDDARDLLAQRLGADRAAAEPTAIDEIMARCARLPLALAVAAARAATRPELPLARTAADLAEAQQRLDVLDERDAHIGIRGVFSWSYERLGAPAARLFRLLGLHPGPDLSVAAAASLAGMDLGSTRRVLAELLRTQLVAESAPGRFTFHDLLREYATEQVREHDSDEDRRAAEARMFGHYLHVSDAALVQLHPHRRALDLVDPAPGTVVERIGDRPAARAWIGRESRVLLPVMHRAVEVHQDVYAWQLGSTIATHLHWSGLWDEWHLVGQLALGAAERVGNRKAQSRIHRSLARVYNGLMRPDDAYVHLQAALALAEDATARAEIHHATSVVHAQRGDYREALRQTELTLDRYRDAGDTAGMANALNSVGWNHILLGDHARGIEACREALGLTEAIGDFKGQANTWDSLGFGHHHLGSYDEAAHCYRQALKLYGELGIQYARADTLARLSATHRAAGDLAEARTALRESLDILIAIGHPRIDEVRSTLEELAT